MILGRIDIARRPAHLRAKRFQCFNQHRGLNRHVQRASNTRAFQRLRLGKFIANHGETGHFGLGDFYFLVTPIGKVQVGDIVVVIDQILGFQNSVHGVSFASNLTLHNSEFVMIYIEHGRKKAPATVQDCERRCDHFQAWLHL